MARSTSVSIKRTAAGTRQVKPVVAAVIAAYSALAVGDDAMVIPFTYDDTSGDYGRSIATKSVLLRACKQLGVTLVDCGTDTDDETHTIVVFSPAKPAAKK